MVSVPDVGKWHAERGEPLSTWAPNDLEFYGVDPDGPSPFEDSNNNVVVPPVTLPMEHQSVQAKVLEQIDPLSSSTEMGIDIYTKIHQIVKESIENI